MSHPADAIHEMRYEPHGDWAAVGALAPATLADARAQLHHAAQLAAAVGVSLIPPRADDSHSNLEWLSATRALATEVVAAPTPVRAAIRVADLTLLVLDEGGAPRAQLPLEGATIQDGFDWLVARLGESGADAARMTLRKHYEIPHNAVDDGAPFTVGDGVTLRELDRYYGNADLLLRQLAAREPNASPVRCWPHHFDIATLLTVAAGRTIGVGMSPGDESYAEPYFYVSPYPYPEPATLPPLALGAWHTAGFTAAIFTAGELVRESDGVAQARLAARFIDDALAAVRSVRA